jgi:hypothetical protein
MTTLRKLLKTRDYTCSMYNDKNVICIKNVPNSGPIELLLCDIDTEECRSMSVDKLSIGNEYIRIETADNYIEFA